MTTITVSHPHRTSRHTVVEACSMTVVGHRKENGRRTGGNHKTLSHQPSQRCIPEAPASPRRMTYTFESVPAVRCQTHGQCGSRWRRRQPTESCFHHVSAGPDAPTDNSDGITVVQFDATGDHPLPFRYVPSFRVQGSGLRILVSVHSQVRAMHPTREQ